MASGAAGASPSRSAPAPDQVTMGQTPVAEPAAGAAGGAPAQRATLLARLANDWPLLAGGLAGGAALGAIVWLVISAASSPPEKIASSTPPATNVASAIDPATAAKPGPSAVRDMSATLEPDGASQVGAAESTTSEPPDENTATSAAPAAPTPPVAEPPSAEQPLAEPTADAAPAAPEGALQEEVKPALKLEPDEAARNTVPSEPHAEVENVASAADEPEGDEASSAAEPAPGEDAAPDVAAEPGDAEAALTDEHVAQRMSVSMGEVKFVAVPLAQFVDFVADASALRMSIDDEALARAGKKRTIPVSVHLSDTTAEEALRAALAPLDLTYVVRGNRVFVTVSAPPATAK
jgi:hypothetical protein